MKIVRIILYVALVVVGLMLWNTWQKESQARDQLNTANGTMSVGNPTIPNTNTTTARTTANQEPSLPTTQNPSSMFSAQKNVINVRTDIFDIMIDPNNGTITQTKLLKYPLDRKDPNQPFILFNEKPKTFYVAQTGLTNLTENKSQSIPFQSEKSSYELAQNEDSLTVKLSWQSPTGIIIDKLYTFTRGKYNIDIQYKIDNKSTVAWKGHYYMQTERRNFEENTDHLVGFHTFFGIAVSSPEKPYAKTTFSKLAKNPLDKNITGGWLAFLQHYFLSAWIPTDNQNYYYYSQNNGNNLFTAGLISDDMTVAPGQTSTVGSQLYVGPELGSQLQSLAPHLSLTIDYGWLWIISIAIFWLMKHIHAIIGNWGWSIVLVTVLIKLLFYKLSETSYKSMAKMRALQPKIQALKERFGDDKQKLNRMIMELYRGEKVNPLGGCLPILIQIPVFIALYWVLVESVELRQAPFILWIHDLAAPDPYYILPILMGLSMFIQQRLSPAPADPTQAKVMMFLPVFFTVFFLGFPSGLVLYWVVNNVISILQQAYITKRFKQGAYKITKTKK